MLENEFPLIRHMMVPFEIKERQNDGTLEHMFVWLEIDLLSMMCDGSIQNKRIER